MKRDSRFVSVPLTLRVGDMEFVDDDSFNQQECLRRMDESEECPRSACPSPEKYMEIFSGWCRTVLCSNPVRPFERLL